MEYDNTNSGAIFKNSKKKETHPDMTGSLNVNGVDFWVSAWTKTDKNGNKYLSMVVNPKDAVSEIKVEAPSVDLPF